MICVQFVVQIECCVPLIVFDVHSYSSIMSISFVIGVSKFLLPRRLHQLPLSGILLFNYIRIFNYYKFFPNV